jgi:uncharacterized Zn ribbon protein
MSIQWSDTNPCPRCHSIYTWSSGSLLICGKCGNQWMGEAQEIRLQKGKRVPA